MSRLIECTIEGPRDIDYTSEINSILELKNKLRINVIQASEELLKFELTGVNVSIANALRRIMMGEVATMAIETCDLYQNTSVIQDEILCNRLGLIPFKIDPNLFDYREPNKPLNQNNSVKFSLHIICPQTIKILPVYSRDFIWQPYSEDEIAKFNGKLPRPVSDDILITKLGPGQEIEIICYLEKGIGKTHAKWSPVCPVYYNLKPMLKLKRDKNNKPIVMSEDEKNELKAMCNNVEFDEFSQDPIITDDKPIFRVCIEKFPDKLIYYKIKDYFIFTVESTCAISSAQIFKESIKIFLNKLDTLKKFLPK